VGGRLREYPITFYGRQRGKSKLSKRIMFEAAFLVWRLRLSELAARKKWGGWTYGPRLLAETLPAWCLAFAIGHSGMTRDWQRALAKGLVALSIGVHFLGVFGYRGYAARQFRHDLPDSI
jgi:hypothetical protein